MTRSKPKSPAEYQQGQSNQAQQANPRWLTHLRSSGYRTHSRQTRTEHKARSTDCFKNNGDAIRSKISAYSHITGGNLPPSTVADGNALHTMLNWFQSELKALGLHHSSESDCSGKSANSTITSHCEAGTVSVDAEVGITSHNPDKISQYEHQVKQGLGEGCDRVKNNQNQRQVELDEILGGGFACAVVLLGLYCLCQKIRRRRAQTSEGEQALLSGQEGEESKTTGHGDRFTNNSQLARSRDGIHRPEATRASEEKKTNSASVGDDAMRYSQPEC